MKQTSPCPAIPLPCSGRNFTVYLALMCTFQAKIPVSALLVAGACGDPQVKNWLARYRKSWPDFRNANILLVHNRSCVWKPVLICFHWHLQHGYIVIQKVLQQGTEPGIYLPRAEKHKSITCDFEVCLHFKNYDGSFLFGGVYLRPHGPRSCQGL